METGTRNVRKTIKIMIIALDFDGTCVSHEYQKSHL